MAGGKATILGPHHQRILGEAALDQQRTARHAEGWSDLCHDEKRGVHLWLLDDDRQATRVLAEDAGNGAERMQIFQIIEASQAEG